MSDVLNIALLGCGTVGGGVVKLLFEQRERITARAGRPIQVKRVVVRDAGKARPACLPRDLISTDINSAVDDPGVHVVAELIGGTDIARQAVLAALAAR